MNSGRAVVELNRCLAEEVGPRKIAQARTVATLDESVARPVPNASVSYRSELMAEGRVISARLSVDGRQLHSRQQLHCRRQLRSAVNSTCAARVRLTGHQLHHTATDSARPPPQPSHPQGHRSRQTGGAAKCVKRRKRRASTTAAPISPASFCKRAFHSQDPHRTSLRQSSRLF